MNFYARIRWLRGRALPKSYKEHLTVEELARNVRYAPKRINVIPKFADVYALTFVALYITRHYCPVKLQGLAASNSCTIG